MLVCQQRQRLLTAEAAAVRPRPEDRSSELQLLVRIRTLWAHISCRSRTCSKSQTHVLQRSCCPAPFCRSLCNNTHKQLNITSIKYMRTCWAVWVEMIRPDPEKSPRTERSLGEAPILLVVSVSSGITGSDRVFLFVELEKCELDV